MLCYDGSINRVHLIPELFQDSESNLTSKMESEGTPFSESHVEITALVAFAINI